MLRSLYSGVSGMKSNQVKMDVIGNNIANVNTTAFKSSRVKFQETLSNTMSTALGPDTSGKGAKNPKQVGLGTTVSSIDTLMTDGVHEPTGRELDFAIENEGFFVTSADIDGNSAPDAVSFTRDGCFYRDSYGTLVNSSGNKVMGYPAIDANTVLDGVTNIDVTGTGTPSTTLIAELTSVINDALSVAETIQKEVENDATQNATAQTAIDDLKAISLTATSTYTNLSDAKTAAITAATSIQSIAKSLADGSGQAIQDFGSDNLRTLEIPTTFVRDDETGLLIKDSDTGKYESVAIGTNQTEVTLDTFNVDASGQITAICSDQNSYKIGRLAVAKFKNREGLTKEGSNSYGKTANSGDPEYGVAGEDSFGTITQGALEVSNVDLANQFTDMIITSRAYQANSRSITTSDEMLQELLNLKR
ncbi:flagellar hook protein FlgE [Clostridium sp. DL1XJH146]